MKLTEPLPTVGQLDTAGLASDAELTTHTSLGDTAHGGLASQAELDTHAALGDTAHGGLASQAELDTHAALGDTAHGGLASQTELDAHTAAASTVGPHNDARIGARVTHSVAQSIANNTQTTVALDTERWDDGGWHDNVTNNSRLTVPAGEPTRRYLIGAQAEWAADIDGYRELLILLNAVTVIARVRYAATATLGQFPSVATVYQLAAGDYVQLLVQHTAGAAINLNQSSNNSPEFWIEAL